MPELRFTSTFIRLSWLPGWLIFHSCSFHLVAFCLGLRAKASRTSMACMSRTRPYFAMAYHWWSRHSPHHHREALQCWNPFWHSGGTEFLDADLKLKHFGEAFYVIILPRFSVIFMNKVFLVSIVGASDREHPFFYYLAKIDEFPSSSSFTKWSLALPLS